MENRDVVIVGGGPAGLAVAARLRQRGITDVVVLERETEAGGVPRHCGHWGFGWESHRRLMTGLEYAARLRADAAGIDTRNRTTVLSLGDNNTLRIQNADGVSTMKARQIVLATGARESTRAARLIGGVRNASIMNTSTLQQLVYLKHAKPFERPIILGGEWVSFSALMTCHHAGIRPVAMIVEEPKIDAPWFFPLGARLRYGVSVHTATKLNSILGAGTVVAVEIEHQGQRRKIICDGVIVTGKFVSEDTLLKAAPIQAPTQAGNMQGPLKTAGRCVAEARRIADAVAERLT